jgi:hypothetical protein
VSDSPKFPVSPPTNVEAYLSAYEGEVRRLSELPAGKPELWAPLASGVEKLKDAPLDASGDEARRTAMTVLDREVLRLQRANKLAGVLEQHYLAPFEAAVLSDAVSDEQIERFSSVRQSFSASVDAALEKGQSLRASLLGRYQCLGSA